MRKGEGMKYGVKFVSAHISHTKETSPFWPVAMGNFLAEVNNSEQKELRFILPQLQNVIKSQRMLCALCERNFVIWL